MKNTLNDSYKFIEELEKPVLQICPKYLKKMPNFTLTSLIGFLELKKNDDIKIAEIIKPTEVAKPAPAMPIFKYFTDDEKAIVEAFEEIFNQERIGIHDDFIKLGGDSLIAIKLISKLNKKSINVDVKNILALRTPRNIAQNINQNEYEFVLAKKGNIDQICFYYLQLEDYPQYFLN